METLHSLSFLLERLEETGETEGVGRRLRLLQQRLVLHVRPDALLHSTALKPCPRVTVAYGDDGLLLPGPESRALLATLVALLPRRASGVWRFWVV